MERRKHYRVAAPTVAPVQAWIRFRGGQQLPARLVNTSAHGVALQVPARSAPALMFGERVSVGLGAPGEGDVVCDAVIRFSRRAGDDRTYGCWFRRDLSETAQGPALRCLLNRRSVPRSRPDPLSVPLLVRWYRATPSGTVELPRVETFDVALRGVGLLASPDAMQALEGAEEVWVQLWAPDGLAPVEVKAKVRNGFPHGAKTRVGLEFTRELAQDEVGRLAQVAPVREVA